MTNENAHAQDDSSSTGSRRRVWLWVVAGIAIVAVIVGVVIAVTSGGHAASPASSSSATASGTATPSASADAGSGSAVPTADPEPERVVDPSVPLDQPVDTPAGVTVRVSSIESVTGEAVVPGEISGPALKVSIEIANGSAETMDLRTAVVTLTHGASLEPGNPISKPGGTPFPPQLAPGESATGAFVFEVPEERRDLVRIDVDLAVSEPIIVFEGAVG